MIATSSKEMAEFLRGEGLPKDVVADVASYRCPRCGASAYHDKTYGGCLEDLVERVTALEKTREKVA